MSVVTVADLDALPPGTVIAGPDWEGEVYQNDGLRKWWAPASEAPWTARSLAPRGPFSVLRRGDEESLSARARVDRRDELAYLVQQAIEGAHLRYDDDDWTRIADALIEQGWTRT